MAHKYMQDKRLFKSFAHRRQVLETGVVIYDVSYYSHVPAGSQKQAVFNRCTTFRNFVVSENTLQTEHQSQPRI